MTFPNLARKLSASAWCTPKTSSKVMDVELAEAFAEILDSEMSKPNLGCATTGQLLDELRSRVDCNYSTVFSERESESFPREEVILVDEKSKVHGSLDPNQPIREK